MFRFLPKKVLAVPFGALAWISCAAPPPIAAVKASYSFAELAKLAASGIPALENSRLEHVSFKSYYQALLAVTDDAAFTIGQHSVANVHTNLLRAASDFAKIDRLYENIAQLGAQTVALNHSPASYSVADSFAATLHDYQHLDSTFSGSLRSQATVWSTKVGGDQANIEFSQRSPILSNLGAIFAMALVKEHLGHALGLGSITMTTNPATSVPVNSPVRKLGILKPSWKSNGSGFFPQPGKMVTAGHCIRGMSDLNFQMSDGTLVPATGWSYNPKWDGTDATRRYDVGVVDFPNNVESNFLPMNYGGAQVGSTADVGGFSSGYLECGTNTVANVDPLYAGSFIMDGTNGGSLMEHGDSGSPAIINGEAAGVTSGGTSQVSIYAPFSENQDYLSQALSSQQSKPAQ